MAELVVLMRAVNVGGRRLPMSELRALCVGLGFEDPETYIQSGNLLIESADSIADTEAKLGKAVEKEFGLEVPLVIRTADSWRGYLDGNPFADDKDVDERKLHLLLAAKPPPKSAVADLEKRAEGGERLRIAGDALWIDFASGIGRSMLTPKAIDKAWGASATARNLRTVHKLQDMIEARR